MHRLLPLTALLLSGCSWLGWHELQPNPDPNHTHADFAIWIDGEMWDFTDPSYMSGVSYDDESHDEEHEYHHEYLHLHDEVGHVLHRHRPGETFGLFLESLGWEFTEECLMTNTKLSVCNDEEKKIRMFVNGEEMVPVQPGYEFKDLDQILVTYGSNDVEIEEQMGKLTEDACIYSKRCPWKGDPPTENCISDPAIPCFVPEEDL